MRRIAILTLVATSAFSGCVATTEKTNNLDSTDYVVTEWCLVSAPEDKVCYETEVERGTDAYTSLEQLAIQSEEVSVVADNYGPELGYYVKEINGLAANNTNYWKLYVNEEESQVGISSVIINVPVKLALEYTAIE